MGPKADRDDLEKRKSFTVLESEPRPVSFLPQSLYRLLYPNPGQSVSYHSLYTDCCTQTPASQFPTTVYTDCCPQLSTVLYRNG